MPRPNPPRRRPRKRPDAQQRAARADAALTKQTAQSTQPKQGQPKSVAPSGGAAVAGAMPDDRWSRRSYAILVGVDCVLALLITTIQWSLAPSTTSNPKRSLALYLVAWSGPLGLVSWLAGSFFGAPLAQRIAGEVRRLRPVESLVVGLVVIFIATFATVAAGVLVGGNPASPSSGGAVATPCPPNATVSCSTPSPTPTSSAAASPSSPASPGSTLGASSSGTVTAGDYGAFLFADAVALVGTVFLYPPLYRRFRMRPRSTGPSSSRGAQRNPRDAKKK